MVYVFWISWKKFCPKKAENIFVRLLRGKERKEKKNELKQSHWKAKVLILIIRPNRGSETRFPTCTRSYPQQKTKTDFQKKILRHWENQAVVRKTVGDYIELIYHTFILSEDFFANYRQFPKIWRNPGVVRSSSNHYYCQAVPGNGWLSEFLLVFPSKTYHKNMLKKYFGCQKTSCRRSANDFVPRTTQGTIM